MRKRQGSLGNVGTRRFVFTNVQAGTSAGDNERSCVLDGTGREISQHKCYKQGLGQAYQNNRNMKNGRRLESKKIVGEKGGEVLLK